MRVKDTMFRSIWIDGESLNIIDQTQLPHEFVVKELRNSEDVRLAIRNMLVRGAGLIGVTAAYGVWLAAREAPRSSLADFDTYVNNRARLIAATRPTAVNLVWALNRQLEKLTQARTVEEKISLAKLGALGIADEDAGFCKKIGQHGSSLIESLYKKKQTTVNVLTHCNAGWLAFVDYGSALSPVYAAHDNGVPVHVWVDETRPRNQGASLTAWELAQHGVPHTLIADNSGGHLMQKGEVDIVITGADRVTRLGDVANKIGTYLKALAAVDNKVPFYVAFPSSTLDMSISDGTTEIEIEERSEDEVRFVYGRDPRGNYVSVQICPDETRAGNWGFDVTPARLITGLITERGVFPANKVGVSDILGDANGRN